MQLKIADKIKTLPWYFLRILNIQILNEQIVFAKYELLENSNKARNAPESKKINRLNEFFREDRREQLFGLFTTLFTTDRNFLKSGVKAISSNFNPDLICK